MSVPPCCRLAGVHGNAFAHRGMAHLCGFSGKARSEVNQWIRTTTEIDGCVDFDRAVCDPAHPTAFADGFDSGDHLHPSAAAYARMAQEVPAALIQKER